MYIMYIQIVLKGIHKTVSTDKRYIYLSEYKRGYKNVKRLFLRLIDSKMLIAILDLLFNDQEKANVSTVQRTNTKENKNGFLGLPSDTP